MKDIKAQPAPCNLVSAKVQIGFENPIFTIEEFTGEKAESEKDERLKTKPWMRYIGIFFAVLSSVVFSLSSVVVVALQSYHAFNISTWRFQGVLLPNTIILLYYWMAGNKNIISSIWPIQQPGARRNLFVLFLRGLLGGGAVVAQVYSLQYLNLGDSTVICFSSPVFVTYLAHFILGETLGIVPVITSIITLGGVVVITRPPILAGGEFSTDTLIGIAMSLVSMLLSAGVLIVLRFLRDVNTTLTTSAFGSIGTLFCLILAFGGGVFQFPDGRDDWIFTITLGVLTFFGQIFFTLALQYEEAGPVSLIRSGDVIFAFIWQFIFLGVQPDIFSIVGAVIVITGVVVIGVRKWIDNLPEESSSRKNLWFLLL